MAKLTNAAVRAMFQSDVNVERSKFRAADSDVSLKGSAAGQPKTWSEADVTAWLKGQEEVKVSTGADVGQLAFSTGGTMTGKKAAEKLAPWLKDATE